MCGDYDSVIGMDKGTAAARFWRRVPGERLAPAEGEATLCGIFVATDDRTGLALRADPLRIGGCLQKAAEFGAAIEHLAHRVTVTS
jgi:calcineurin-like phosphoesterase